MSLRKSILTIGSLTFVSRILGFIRDILIAAIMGAGFLTDVFFVAFKLPNFFRRLFGEGAFNAAFVPMFSSILARDGKEKARVFAENVLAVMVFVLASTTVLMQIFMPWVMYALAPGFAEDKAKFDLAIYLTRITFFYLLFISLVSLFSGVLNSLNKFAAAAAAPIMLNICLIAAILWLNQYTETPAHALSYGVAVAGLVQFMWLLVACRRAGMSFRLKRPSFANSNVKKLLKLMLPGIVGAGVVQINLWIDIIIGTLIPSAISYLYFADRINQLPLGVIGVAIGVALLPTLARQLSEGKKEQAMSTQNRALEAALLFALPAMVAFVVIAEPIISTLFERGEFDFFDTLATSYGLVAYSLGLPAFIMVKVLTQSYFARHDTKTPVKFAIVAMVINLTLNLSFVFSLKYIGFFPHVGIALATSIAAWVNVYMLALGLKNKKHFVLDKRLKKNTARIIISSLLMGAVLLLARYFLEGLMARGEIFKIPALVIMIGSGALTYFISVYYLKVLDMGELKKMLKRKKGKHKAS